MNKTNRLKGLYIVTDRQLSLDISVATEKLVAKVIEGGASIIQYRNKQSALTIRRHEAAIIAVLCKETGTTFLVNDDVELAIEVDADGVHLGQSDTPLSNARKLLGEDKIIGITCHNDLELAKQAEQGGADYVAFGRFYPSMSKPTAAPASVDVLKSASEQLDIPICAIGGINQNNASALIIHGADMLAVTYSVLGAKKVAQAAAQIEKSFTK